MAAQWLIVYFNEDECTYVGDVVGPFNSDKLAKAELKRTSGRLREDEYGVYRDEDDNAVAQLATLSTPTCAETELS